MVVVLGVFIVFKLGVGLIRHPVWVGFGTQKSNG